MDLDKVHASNRAENPNDQCVERCAQTKMR
jgi:hypothetical protein